MISLKNGVNVIDYEVKRLVSLLQNHKKTKFLIL